MAWSLRNKTLLGVMTTLFREVEVKTSVSFVSLTDLSKNNPCLELSKLYYGRRKTYTLTVNRLLLGFLNE